MTFDIIELAKEVMSENVILGAVIFAAIFVYLYWYQEER